MIRESDAIANLHGHDDCHILRLIRVQRYRDILFDFHSLSPVDVIYRATRQQILILN